MDAVRRKWAEEQSTIVTPAVQEENIKLAAKRKDILKIINWLNDKHRTLAQILDTLTYLKRICENVRDNPEDQKFRKIRITNKAFGLHVRDAPGAESFMIAAGFHAIVQDYVGYFVIEAAPGTLEWTIFLAALKELNKLHALIEAKIARRSENKKAELEAQRVLALAALEDDKQERHLRFTYSNEEGDAAGGAGGQPAASPR